MGRPRTRGVTPEEEITNHTGVEIHGKSLRITFAFQGGRCRETLSIPVTVANIKLAANKRAAILHEISMGTFDYARHFPNSIRAGVSLTVRNIKLRALCDRYIPIKAMDITSDTESRYQTALSACCGAVGWNVSVNTLRPEDVDKLRSDLIASLETSTANHYLATWNGMMEWARQNDYTKAVLKASFFKNVAKDPDPLSFDEFERIIKDGCLHEQDKALVTLAVYTGLRPGELCALAREDVDGCKLYIRRAVTDKGMLKLTKTGQERVVWLVPPAMEAVRVLLRLSERQKPETETIHISRHQTKTEKLTSLVAPIQARNLQIAGRRLKPQSWATKWTKLLSRANVRRRVAYQTRHTYACWSLTAHGNIAYIASQMGHKDFSMLVKVYGRWMDSASQGEADFIWQQLEKSGAFCPEIAPSE